MRKLLTVFTTFTMFWLCMGSFITVNAKETDEAKELYTSQVNDYVRDIKQTFEFNYIFSERVDKGEEVGTPFIIYLYGTNKQDKIYYYPVSDADGTIQFVVEAVVIDGVAECNISDNLVDALNYVEYGKDGALVYQYDNLMYIETADYVLNVCNYYNPDTESTYFKESKWGDPFEEKCNVIHEAEKNMVEYTPYVPDNIDELLDTKMYGDLSLSNPMGQYKYNMCWASSVATIHNYLLSSVVTGYEVCTRMGIGYNDGGTIFDEQDALALYNITYNSIRNSALTWDQLSGNINVSKPIIANGIPTSGLPHAVTIYGYSGSSSSTSNVAIWNSNANGGTGGYSTFTYSTGVFTASAVSYTWVTSLSYQ